MLGTGDKAVNKPNLVATLAKHSVERGSYTNNLAGGGGVRRMRVSYRDKKGREEFSIGEEEQVLCMILR